MKNSSWDPMVLAAALLTAAAILLAALPTAEKADRTAAAPLVSALSVGGKRHRSPRPALDFPGVYGIMNVNTDNLQLTGVRV